MQKSRKAPAVYLLTRASRCYNCDSKLEAKSIVQLKQSEDEREVLCRKCAGLDSLEFLGSGNTKITQLAKKYSTKTYVVMQWSELWKCYERQGLLLESPAIDKAETELGLKANTREK